MLGGIAEISGAGWTVIVAAALVVMFFLFVLALSRRYMKVGPNEALIISGRGGYRVKKGGGTFVLPIIEKSQILSLEVMTLDIRTPEVYSVTGVPIIVDGVAQIKIGGDEPSIRTAAEQFLTKSRADLMEVARQTLEGHLRAIIGTLSVEDIYKNREAFAQRVQETAAIDLANMGLKVVSFTLRDIKDNQGYLDALGKPRIAQVRKDAVVGQAIADREAVEKSAAAKQAAEEARYAAETKIAEAKRNFEMKQADYQAGVNERKAAADLAYDLQKFRTNQQVKAEEVNVQIVEKERLIQVQEKEIARKQKELEATVSRPADAERYRIQTLAEAEKFKLLATSEGQMNATKNIGFGDGEAEKSRGFARAAVVKAEGLAEAEVILAKGQSEAQAMAKKAEAWRAYNEAAIAQMIIERLPEIARAIAEPLAKTEKIVIVNTGGSDGAGASKVTRDITHIVAQVPPVVEALTGLKLEDLLKRVPKIGGPEGEEKK